MSELTVNLTSAAENIRAGNEVCSLTCPPPCKVRGDSRLVNKHCMVCDTHLINTGCIIPSSFCKVFGSDVGNEEEVAA